MTHVCNTFVTGTKPEEEDCEGNFLHEFGHWRTNKSHGDKDS